MMMKTEKYETWLQQVEEALNSINMPMQDWQNLWAFDFSREHGAGASPDAAAMKANRYWWHQQNKSLNRDCEKTAGCWLPRAHEGDCQPM
jgi:hypothetical protein